MATPLKAVPGPGKRIEVPIKKATGPGDDKIHTWPHLVRNEFLIACAMMILLIVWSLLVDAPLEEPANPTRTPNPSKAPWYFLGLQEMLVFFDPWHAGVVLPTFIILGLMVIPYPDINPKGNGYYCWKDRKWEIMTFIVGFAGFYAFCRSVQGANFPAFMERWGWARFGLTGFLFLNMWAVVAKMLMRHLLNIKYIMVLKTPYFSINI